MGERGGYGQFCPISMASEVVCTRWTPLVLRELLARAMPGTAIDRDDAVDAFMAHLVGTLVAWQSRDDVDLRLFLRQRTMAWIRLAGISFEEVDRG